MDFYNQIIDIIGKIIEKRKECLVNITHKDDKLTVNIFFGKEKKSFSNYDGRLIISQLTKYLSFCI
jgi:hypothetical protein